MKSLANSLLNIAHGLLKDVRVAYPTMRGVDLDSKRLSRNCQCRGLSFFSLDLPSLDNLLTEGLECGRLELKGPLSQAVSKRIRVPRLFSGLWLRVFDSRACLREDVDVNAIAFLRQLICLGKRIQAQCSPARLEQAIRTYHAIESQLWNPSLNWDGDQLDHEVVAHKLHLSDVSLEQLPLFPGSTDFGDRKLRGLLTRCQQVADIILDEFDFFEPVTYSGDLHLENRPSGFRHGPGAVADRRGLVNKYEFPRWSSKLDVWFPYRQCGTIATDMETNPMNHEVASRLIAVPKTAKAPRLIASEPTEHQWCQQVIRHFMVSELRRLFGEEFICFEKQELSGDMALSASHDGKMCTIDLSSASDRLSCWVVERVFRKHQSLLHSLHSTRTRYIRDDISQDGTSFIKLRKFASQGTATTFPVQTFVFLCLALGCSIQGQVTWTKIRRLGGKVRVFGDDIIMPNTRYADMVAVLQVLGLKANVEKSFHNGQFRESCGVDAYKGYNVTPTKPLTTISDGPSSRQAVLDVSNNLFRKGYWHASIACESALGPRILRGLPIVGRGDGSTGRFSFVGGKTDHLPKRWNARLHRTEYAVWTVKTVTKRRCLGERFALLQYFTEAPAQDFNPTRVVSYESGLVERPRLKETTRWDPLYGIKSFDGKVAYDDLRLILG
jgi:hypothetical protein